MNLIKMTKEPDKSGNWKSNYNNKSMSGIEVKDKNGELVNFITIRHDEVLENGVVHRITIKLDENAKPLLPPPQTFEEIIQAKRRQQMLLYGSGQSSSAILSSRTARRVAAAARQTATAVATASSSLSRRPVASLSRSRPRPRPRPRPSSNRNRNRSRSSSSKSRSRKKPPLATSTPTMAETTAIFAESDTPIPPTPTPPSSTVTPTKLSAQHSSTPVAQSKKTINAEPEQRGEDPKPSTSGRVVTSMKDLEKNHLFKTADFDPKEVKLLLKSAAPGASIVLPNGTVIKKSRRGGARVGAGRKRSRPLPLSAQQTSSSSRNSNGGSQPPISSNSSFSSQA